jgi:hypothetical protein
MASADETGSEATIAGPPSPENDGRSWHSVMDIDDLLSVLKAAAHAESAIQILQPLLEAGSAPEVEEVVHGIDQALSTLRKLASGAETIGVS